MDRKPRLETYSKICLILGFCSVFLSTYFIRLALKRRTLGGLWLNQNRKSGQMMEGFLGCHVCLVQMTNRKYVNKHGAAATEKILGLVKNKTPRHLTNAKNIHI